MTGPEQLIADALREIAADAPAPRPMADAAWRAGRRGRMRVLAASAAAGAGTIAAAVVLTLAAVGTPARTGSPAGPGAPLILAKPIEFQQVVAISHDRRCRPGDLPGTPVPTCVQLTGPRMTVMALQSWRIVRARPRSYVLDIHLTIADSHRLAALTRRLAGQPSPRDQLAIIIGGIVFSRSEVLAPITNGQTVINPGYTGPDGLEAIQHHLR